MIAICPAGPPKLIKPSFNQNQKACSRLTLGAGKGLGGSTGMDITHTSGG
jgi:hypothetical protein